MGTVSKQEKIDALIERMPARVREEVARLKAEVERLKAEMAQRGKDKSRVFLSSPSESVKVPLPEDKDIRFNLGKESGPESIVSVRLSKDHRKEFWLEIHGVSWGSLHIRPGSSNTAFIKLSDL